jgi:hypothetical protein
VSSSNCSSHGEPVETNGTSISSADGRYPGYLTYCKFSINDGSPDTVQGTFALVKAITCALEANGLTFDGTATSITITPSAACFTAGQLTDIGTSPMTLTVTGSKPASFNTYFDSGIHVTQSAMDLDFKLAVKVTASSIEFATYDTNAAGNKFTATAGALDLTTGVIRAESRIQRIDCPTSSSCGWNRHWRIYADMTMVNGTPDALETLSFAYSNISATPGPSSLNATKTSGLSGRAFLA